MGTTGEWVVVTSNPRCGVRVVGNKVRRHRTLSGVAERVSTWFCKSNLSFNFCFAAVGVPKKRTGVLQFFFTEVFTDSNMVNWETLIVTEQRLTGFFEKMEISGVIRGRSF